MSTQQNYKKHTVLVADDNHKDVDYIISLFLPNQAPDYLYLDECSALIKPMLDMKIYHSVPEALDYLSNNPVPDLVLIDINFSHAEQHVSDLSNINDEGLILVNYLKQYRDLDMFCISNFFNWEDPLIELFHKQGAAILKSNGFMLTEKVVSALQKKAANDLATLSTDQQTRLLRRLKAQGWLPEDEIKLPKGRYLLKDLMVGWAVLQYDAQNHCPILAYPPNIVEITQALLPYAKEDQSIGIG